MSQWFAESARVLSVTFGRAFIGSSKGQAAPAQSQGQGAIAFRVRSLDRVSLQRVDDVLRGMTSVQLFAKNSRCLLSCRPGWPSSETS
jgi:hypothetical protein